MQPPAITGDTLPLEASSATNLIDRLSVGFNKDVATNFNALNRVVLTYGGHSYLLTDNAGSSPQAEAQAQTLGGHLTTINDAAENDWLSARQGSVPKRPHSRRHQRSRRAGAVKTIAALGTRRGV